MAGSAAATPETPPPSDRDAAGNAAGVSTERAVPGELFAPVSPGIELCYQTYGDPADEPMIMVMGLSSPMIWWDPELCSMLARRGYFVITFDNRDVGRSTRVRGRVTRQMLLRAFAGLHVRAPYSLGDMARDAFGLLDHLGIERAHVVGASMGGMIAQTMAIEEPARVLSLTSIMSTTGNREVGQAHPEGVAALLRAPASDREGFAEGAVAAFRAIGSKGFEFDEEGFRSRALRSYDRGYNP